MFRVSAVLRRYDADVPPTAVGACDRRLQDAACAFSRVGLLMVALSTSVELEGQSDVILKAHLDLSACT